MTVIASWTLLLAASLPVYAQVRYPPRPAAGEVVFDEAGLLKPADLAEVRRLSSAAEISHQAPIMVATLKSLADYGASAWPIERYAMNLFAEWGIGRAESNTGMLLLVAVRERKARIELGAGWGRAQDDGARQIMDHRIIPQFKRGDFSQGILEGVKGLERMAASPRTGRVQTPHPPTPTPPLESRPPPPPTPAPPAGTLPPDPPRPQPYSRPSPEPDQRYYGSRRTTGVPGVLSGILPILLGIAALVGLVMIVLYFVRRQGQVRTWTPPKSDALSSGASAFAGGCLGAGAGHMISGGRRSWYRPGNPGWDSFSHHSSFFNSSPSRSSFSGGSSFGSSSSGGGFSSSTSSGSGFSGGGGATGSW